MNAYLASQLVAERQATLTAEITRRAQVKEARAARKTTATSPRRTARIGRLVFGRPAPATA